MNKKGKTQRGITLIALVITIIVMLILVAVTISMAVNGGLFEYAGKAVGDTQNALETEQELSNGKIQVDEEWYNSIEEYLEKDEVETISKTESYVGYYADVDADGIVDGVIYADLSVGGSGQYEDVSETCTYTINAVTGVKNYYVSKTNHEGTFGTKDVLTAIGTGKDRFYVMALSDFTESGENYCWYAGAYGNMSDYETVTSGDFETGKTNTATLIEKWNNSTYGDKDTGSYKDVWGQIQTQVQKGWFVPSIVEWVVFDDVFGIDSTNFDDVYGLRRWYWTSSVSSSEYAIEINFYDDGILAGQRVNNDGYVRLSTTF